MKEFDFEVKEEMKGALLLSRLPDEYKPMIMDLENTGTIVTSSAIKIKLFQEVRYNRKQTGETEVALYSKVKATRKKGNKKNNKKRRKAGATHAARSDTL